jgi:hypothetical protein
MHASGGMDSRNRIELDATKAAKALRLTLPDLKKAQVSFFVKGSTLKGKEVKTEAQISIQHIGFSLSEFKN